MVSPRAPGALSTVCCSLPLQHLADAHLNASRHGVTIVTTRVPQAYAPRFGCIITDPDTHEIKHYVEKPKVRCRTIARVGSDDALGLRAAWFGVFLAAAR